MYMKSPLRTLSISVLGLAVAGLIGVSTAGSASAYESKATSPLVSISAPGVHFSPDSWSWGGRIGQ